MEDEGDNSDDMVPEAAPTSTTPPVSPRRRALPVCSPATGLLDGGSTASETVKRDIPRLAGLADYAMRVFLTE